MTERESFLAGLLIVDTETTSAEPTTAEVIEIGHCYRLMEEWQMGGSLYKPHNKIPAEASSVCYISNKMVEGHPHFDEDNFDREFLNGSSKELTLVAHNAHFDETVLANYDVRFAKSICTLKMAKKLFHDDDDVTMLKLQYLRYYLDLEIPDTMLSHRASADCFMTGKLLEKFLDIMEENGIIDPALPYEDQVTAWLDEPIKYTTMPFGKHKGTAFKHVPVSYWKWAFANMDVFDEEHDSYDEGLATSVAEALDGKL